MCGALVDDKKPMTTSIYRPWSLSRLGVVLLLTSSSVGAEGNSALSEIVVTVSRVQQSISTVSGNITRIDRDTVAQVGHAHINELMQRVAGVWISRGNGQEHLTAIRSPVLTGAGACGAFLLAQDGVPIRANGFCNVNELFEAITEQASAIEVIRGPSGVSYGSNALHGVLNVLSPDVRPVGELSLETGANKYLRSKLSYGGERHRVDLHGTQDGGYKDQSGFDQQKITLQRNVEDAQGRHHTVLHYTNLNQETAGFVRGADIYLERRNARTNPNPEAFRDARSIRLTHRFSADWKGNGQLIVTSYGRWTDMEFLQHFLPGQALEENRHHSIGLMTSLHTGPFLFGFDADLTQGQLAETQARATVGSPFLVATIPAGQHYDYEVKATTLAGFLDWGFSLGTNTLMTVGSRGESVLYDYTNHLPIGRTRADGTVCSFGGCRFNRPASRSDDFVNVSSKLSLLHNVSTALQFYGKVTKGFRAPQTTELYRLQAGQSVSNIGSESIRSAELGVRGFSQHWLLDASAYHMTKDNFIFRDTNRRNVDNGETSHRGIDFSVHWFPTKVLTASLQWSLAQHKYDNTPALSSSEIRGNEIDTAPSSFGSLQLAWAINPNWDAEIEWTHLGSYFQDPENNHEYPGHSLINLRVFATRLLGWDWGLRIMNVVDENYAERADFAFGEDRYFIGEPRRAFLSVTIPL